MIRRDFIKHSGIAAAGTSLIGNSKSWAGANEKVGIAQIGMGGRGGELMLHWAKLDGAEVRTICDPDERRMERWGEEHQKAAGKKPKYEPDLRKIMEDDNIDAVVLTCCNHWHTPAAIWACQAGKHAYVEKPVSHNIVEGQKLTEAARKYNRIVQGGTQRRSDGLFRKAAQLLHDGVIGDIYMARALIFGKRDSVGFKPMEQPPDWLHWDLWLGPAPQQAYHGNLAHYNWHWFWDFGNGEIGNNGSHALDVIRWGLNKELPSKVYSVGGRFGYEDQAETPNTQATTFEYEDGTILTCETRGLYSNAEAKGIRWGGMFYGSEGYMTLKDNRYEIYMGRNTEPEPDRGRLEQIDHYKNFIDAIRANDSSLLRAEIKETALSCALCHLGNIAYRLGRELHFDPKRQRFFGDAAANQLLSRKYRKPFEVPKTV